MDAQSTNDALADCANQTEVDARLTNRWMDKPDLRTFAHGANLLETNIPAHGALADRANQKEVDARSTY